jgi:murein DD-endopeptidase MepM/ murein hydrolase activator NlpD
MNGYIYEVVSGDSIIKISNKTGIDIQILIHYNQELAFQKYLSIGQKIFIPEKNALVYQVKKGDNLIKISRNFFTTAEIISEYNNLNDLNSINVGQKLLIPHDYVGSCYNTNLDMGWPVIGYISSPYGMRFHPILKVNRFHSGLDIANSMNTPIFSVVDGFITEVGYDKNGYGIYVRIKAEDKIFMYAHLNSVNVVPGIKVKQGNLIGKMGTTGLSTGPHLHFQVENFKGETYDPLKYLGNMNATYDIKMFDAFKVHMGGE